MDAYQNAIKEVIALELQAIRDDVTKQEQRSEELAKSVQDLSGKMAEREQEAEKVQESFNKLREDLEASAASLKAQLDEDIVAMKARLDKFDDDPDGAGGSKQVHEKIGHLEKALGESKLKIDEDVRLVKENNTRTEAAERKLLELSRQCEDVAKTSKASEQRLASVEGVCSAGSSAQEALQDSISRKYENLWEDVLRAIEDMKGNLLKNAQEDLDGRFEATKAENRSLVNYALNFMSTAHGERRQQAINKQLVQAWKEQTWNSSRRRLGIAYLHKIVQRRKLVVFDSWNRRHTTDELCKRLHGQYEGQLGAVYKKIEDESGQLKKHCTTLDGSVSKLEEDKSTKLSLDASVKDLRGAIEELKVKAIAPINSTLKEHHDAHERFQGLHRGHSDQENNLDQKISIANQELSGLSLKCCAFAKIDDVDNMVRDVLMIWNSIKQLDTSKADKKDVDSFALETGNRDKLASRRLEDLVADITMRSKQETLGLQEKWTEMDGRLDESGRQFRHWEQMWEKLSGFVEDLVGKIGDLQGSSDKKLPSATLRAPPRRGPSQALSQSRLVGSTMATLAGEDTATSAVSRGGYQHLAAAEGLDSKMLWINSAKGIVDATIDQAVTATTPASARPRPRPKSATGAASGGRRPHDRAGTR